MARRPDARTPVRRREEEGDACASDGASRGDPGAEEPRARIIAATFAVLMERGYGGASTREIARRARVSKRELYAFFDSKAGILAAMIAERAQRMRAPLALPEINDAADLVRTLIAFGAAVMTEVSSPAVLALFRLAIGEAGRAAGDAPTLARALDEGGRRANRAALRGLLARAQALGLIGEGDCDVMAGEFLALLWGDRLLLLLAGLAPPPNAGEIDGRTRRAAHALRALNPPSAAEPPLRRRARNPLP
jgi:AcrR family transcriptional regulator